MDILQLLFSPQGTVGRGTWWLAQIVVLVVILSVEYKATNSMDVVQTKEVVQQILADNTQGQQLSWVERCGVIRERNIEKLSRLWQQGFDVELLLLLLCWPLSVIEIKRWHDRGYTGFLILLRLLGWVLPFHSAWAFYLFIIISLWALVELGFRGERGTKWVTYADPYSTWGRINLGLSLCGFGLLVLFLYAENTPFAVAGYSSTRLTEPIDSWTARLKAVNFFSFSSLVTTPASPAAPRLPEDQPYYGTDTPNYDKSSITVDGVKYSGITQAVAGPHGQIALICDAGTSGLSFPASSLPQAFLDSWSLTPDRLKAVDGK